MDKLKSVPFECVDITDGFWAARQKINRETTIFAVEDRFDETGRFEAFDCNWQEGSSSPKPHYFWDSDIAKWIESAAYIIAKNEDADLMDRVEEVIDNMEKNQWEDGYFNIYFSTVEKGKRFTNRDCHELYCLGHMIEAAIAYYNATSRDRLLKITEKYIDLVIKIFTVEKSAAFLTPGHEEIELALIKLYRLTGDKKYLDLAMFFLDNRSKDSVSEKSWCNDKNNQSHLPVRQQFTAEGHSVRACYLYSAMADAAYETSDAELLSACKAIFDDITLKKMYITGGIGSSSDGEAFTTAYDLPNKVAYAETCAAISLMMFSDRMKNIDFDSKYADTVERIMYNGCISGVSLDGKSFFYVNPLEIDVSLRERNTSVNNARERYPITERREVFDCSCCPPNLTRVTASVGGSLFSANSDSIFIHQYMSSCALFDIGGNSVEINMDTEYPSDGKISVNVTGAKGKNVYLRIPGWCTDYKISPAYTVENGYAHIIPDSDIFDISVDFVMKPRFTVARSEVTSDCGRAALMYGPVVYCAERKDNDFDIFDAVIDTKSDVQIVYSDYFGCNTVSLGCDIADTSGFSGLYDDTDKIKLVRKSIKLIPYFGFANRGESDMRVFFPYK